MPNPYLVQLGPDEMLAAIEIGAERYWRSMVLYDKRGLPHEWLDDMFGALGELAVANAIGFDWFGSQTDEYDYGGDCGPGIQVRTALIWQHCLGVKRPPVPPDPKGDAPDHRFIFCTPGPGKRTIAIRGWILGSEAQTEDHWQTSRDWWPRASYRWVVDDLPNEFNPEEFV